MKRSIVLSIAIGGYRHIFKRCIDSQRKYAATSGYDYFILDQTPWRVTANDAAWMKIRLLQEALTAGYEQIMFIDADCEVRPHAPPIFESVIRPNKYLYAALGKSGRYNSGVIVAINNTHIVDFMQRMLDNAESAVPPEHEAPYENGHFISYAQGLDWVAPLSHDTWNNNSYLNINSAVQHFSGGALRQYYKVTSVSPWARMLAKFESVSLELRKPPAAFSSEPSVAQRLNLLRLASRQKIAAA